MAGYAIALGVLAWVLVPGQRGPETLTGAESPLNTQIPSSPSSTAPAAPVSRGPAPVPTSSSEETAQPTPEATRTHRTARTPAPDPDQTTAPPTAEASPLVAPLRATTPAPRPTPSIQTSTPGPDGPPGGFAITSSTDLDECNGGSSFTVTWSRSEGATRYTVYASNQGSVIVSGTTTTLACPTRAGAFSVTVIAYNDRMQGTNAPTVTYHEPVPLDDPTPGSYETAPVISTPSQTGPERQPSPTPTR